MSQPTIPPEDWSRDHWTLLAYAFTRLGRGGYLEPLRLRFDGNRYPTRTRRGIVPEHTDEDCLRDLEAAGVLKTTGARVFLHVRFTPFGLVLGQWLCEAMASRTIQTRDLTWAAACAASGASFSSPVASPNADG